MCFLARVMRKTFLLKHTQTNSFFKSKQNYFPCCFKRKLSRQSTNPEAYLTLIKEDGEREGGLQGDDELKGSMKEKNLSDGHTSNSWDDQT